MSTTSFPNFLTVIILLLTIYDKKNYRYSVFKNGVCCAYFGNIGVWGSF